ncbi:hypothetical protein JCM11491_005598 [Sporobolomyces phaffii]
MITYFGWSVQLYLGVDRFEPFDVHVAADSTAVATFAAPPHRLAVGAAWVVVWRDERPTAHPAETVVGLVSEVEGEARDSAATLVGTAVSPPPPSGPTGAAAAPLPCVRGIVRMGISPLRVHLVLRESHPTPVALGTASAPLATFDLVVYPDAPPPATDQGLAHGSPTTAFPHPSVSRQHQLHEEHHAYAPTSPSPAPAAPRTVPPPPPPPALRSHEHVHDGLLEARVAHLERDLAHATAHATYFEQTVRRVYALLAPGAVVEYLSARLEGRRDGEGGVGEALAPDVRIAVAIAREEARDAVERAGRAAVANEVARVVDAVKAATSRESKGKGARENQDDGSGEQRR